MNLKKLFNSLKVIYHFTEQHILCILILECIAMWSYWLYDKNNLVILSSAVIIFIIKVLYVIYLKADIYGRNALTITALYFSISFLIILILYKKKVISKQFLKIYKQWLILGIILLILSLFCWGLYFKYAKSELTKIGISDMRIFGCIFLKSGLEAIVSFLGISGLIISARQKSYIYFTIPFSWISAFVFPILDAYKYIVSEELNMKKMKYCILE